jgi:hypothetical protein
MVQPRLWAVFVYHGSDENDVITAVRFAKIQGMEPHLISIEKQTHFHHGFHGREEWDRIGDEDACEVIQKYMLKRAPSIYIEEYSVSRIVHSPIIVCLSNGALVFADFWYGPGNRRYEFGVVVGGDFSGIKRRNPAVIDDIKKSFEGNITFPDEEDEEYESLD